SNGDARGPEGTQAAPGKGSAASDGDDSPEAAGVTDTARGSLPKRARLRRRGDFLRVQPEGRRHHTDDFVLIAAPAAAGTSRVGTTGRTRVGNGVVGNRIKRLLREALRRRWRTIAPPADVVVIAKPSAAKAGHAGVVAQLEHVLAARGR